MVAPTQQALSPRRPGRLEIALELSLESEHQIYLGLTENIAEGGVFIATHRLYPMGTLLTLKITLPDERPPLVAVGMVRWVRTPDEAAETPAGMGVQFVQLDEDEAARLRDLLEARAPLFFEP